MNANSMMLLVGDNPFLGVSHLSQDRNRSRETWQRRGNVEYAAELVRISAENGADGFMFSVCETTLSILRILRRRGCIEKLKLYAIAPYAYEYVRMATQTGGVSGSARNLAKQVILSGNFQAVALGAKGILRLDLASLLKAYIAYEISRIRSSAGKQAKLESVMLHEIVTEMGLAFKLDWIFKAYTDFVANLDIRPGFETRNFAYLVRQFRAWDIDFKKVTIAAPFNVVGFQMNPSKAECERALEYASESENIGFSIMAGGYVQPKEAIEYVRSLRNLKGVAVGVSREDQARNTFQLLSEQLKREAEHPARASLQSPF